MSKNIDVVKSNKKTESFSIDKLRKSIKSACRASNSYDGDAEDTAKIVAREVCDWIENKKVITTQDIRKIVVEILERYNPDAAYFYDHYKSII